MSGNQGKDTSPELIIRRIIHALGYRYRLYRRDLPGCPDMVFPGRKKVIFINGCYWHRHHCKKGRSVPETRKDFWQNKFTRTIRRDQENRKKLKKLGWRLMTIWECQIHPKKMKLLKVRVEMFLVGGLGNTVRSKQSGDYSLSENLTRKVFEKFSMPYINQ